MSVKRYTIFHDPHTTVDLVEDEAGEIYRVEDAKAIALEQAHAFDAECPKNDSLHDFIKWLDGGEKVAGLSYHPSFMEAIKPTGEKGTTFETYKKFGNHWIVADGETIAMCTSKENADLIIKALKAPPLDNQGERL